MCLKSSCSYTDYSTDTVHFHYLYVDSIHPTSLLRTFIWRETWVDIALCHLRFTRIKQYSTPNIFLTVWVELVIIYMSWNIVADVTGEATMLCKSNSEDMDQIFI